MRPTLPAHLLSFLIMVLATPLSGLLAEHGQRKLAWDVVEEFFRSGAGSGQANGEGVADD